MKFDLAVEVRQGVGKGPARQLRRAGKVPAVLYGQGECLLLTVNPDDLVKILRSHAGATALISLTVNGARVVKADIDCTNGMVHAIDAVLLPPQ